MKIEKKAGYKEFFIALGIVVALYILTALLGIVIKNTLLANLLGIAVFCYYGYFVLVRYASVYTYEIEPKKITITRKIGHRTKSAEVKKRDIVLITKTKPQLKTVYNFSRFVADRKRVIYIVFINDGVREALIIERDKVIMNTLKELGYIE